MDASFFTINHKIFCQVMYLLALVLLHGRFQYFKQFVLIFKSFFFSFTNLFCDFSNTSSGQLYEEFQVLHQKTPSDSSVS